MGDNTSALFAGSAMGATPEYFDGPRAVNAHLFGSANETPYMPGLMDGVATAGILKRSNAGSFPEVLANAPANARMALLRLGGGIARQHQAFTGFDMMLLINLTCEDLASPQVGMGSEGELGPLLLDGPSFNPDFGGFGAIPRETLTAYCVYATWVPEDVEWFNMAYVADGSVNVSQSRQRLASGEAMYVTHGEVNCPGPIPLPNHGDENIVLLHNMTVNAMGQMEFDLWGAGDVTWQIESTANFNAWSWVGSVTLVDGVGHFVDTRPGQTGSAIYRAAQ